MRSCSRGSWNRHDGRHRRARWRGWGPDQPEVPGRARADYKPEVPGRARADYKDVEDERRRVLARARDAGSAVLAHDRSAINAVTEAICVLEDAPLFNAGTGSVLTWDGAIEMDASIMTDGDAFGGVGALRAVRNPVRAARAIEEATAAGCDAGLIVVDRRGGIAFNTAAMPPEAGRV